MINAALQNAAPMAVRRYIHTLSSHSIVDELVITCRKSVQAFLDHVVPVQIFDQRDDIARKRVNDSLSLRWR